MVAAAVSIFSFYISHSRISQRARARLGPCRRETSYRAAVTRWDHSEHVRSYGIISRLITLRNWQMKR